MTPDHPPGDSSSDNAGVRVFPPALYLGPLAVGLLIDRLRPWRMPAGPASRVLGGALTAGGVALAAPAAATFRRVGTPLPPVRPVTTLVTSGPYRFTRNPIYLGMAVTYTGISVLTRSWWPLPLLPAAVLAVDRLVIAREEPYLQRRFGAAYDDYCARVRRWL